MKRAPCCNLAFIAGSAALFACPGPDTKNDPPPPEPRTITTRSVALAAQDNLTTVAGGAAALADLLEALELPFLGDRLEAPRPPEGFAARVSGALFAEAAVESAQSTRITYLLRAEDVCEGAEGCAAFLRDVPIRLIVTSHAEGDLDAAIEFGHARSRPAVLRIHRTRVAAEVDLAEIHPTLQQVEAALDDFTAPAIEASPGRVVFTLEKTAADRYTARADIPGKLALIARTEQGAIHVLIERSEPALAVDVDSAAAELTVRSKLGATGVLVSAGVLAAMDILPGLNGLFGIHLPAIDARASMKAGEDVLRIRLAALGRDTARIIGNGHQLAELDVSAMTGEEVAIEIHPAEEGTAIAFEPGLRASLQLALHHLAPDVEIPAWAANETFNAAVGGASRPELLIPARAPRGVVGKVASGTWTLAASSIPAPIAVGAGSCLRYAPPAEDDAHPFSTLFAGTCE